MNCRNYSMDCKSSFSGVNIASNDSIIMKPPYDITPAILGHIAPIAEKTGEINAAHKNPLTFVKGLY